MLVGEITSYETGFESLMMERHVSGEINTDTPPAVRSLRSKFEQLAVEKSTGLNSAHNGGARSESGSRNELLAPGGPASPRPRASSNTYSNSQPEIQHLRSSSSSSDLKGTKRPPPPPPPSRGLKATPALSSPVPASPLLRPVPIPPISNGSPRLGSASLPTNGNIPGLPYHAQESSGNSVASLRNKFGGSPIVPARTHNSRPSITSVYPATPSEPNTASTSSLNKPPVPPRPSKTTDVFLYPPIAHTQSPDNMSDSSSAASSLRPTVSPFSDDDESEPTPLAAPSLPVWRHNTHHRGSSTHSTDSSMTSSESETSHSSSVPLPKSILPPRPPSRYRATASPSTFDAPLSSSPMSSSTTLAPPPLPIRRSTIAQPDETISVPTPRIPNRPNLAIPSYIGPPDSPAASPTTAERKALGSGRLPPPPTRTIALGDKLPPARRPSSPSSDEDSGEEDDSKVQIGDSLPDSSRSSRRPPVLSFREGHAEPKIQVHAFSGVTSVAGTTAVVAHNHHIKVYDLAMSDVPMQTLDTKALGKDVKVTSMEFRPCAKRADRGFILWVGTKEGHLFELDARTATVVAAKHMAHLQGVTHIFRHGRSMVTLDDSGKGLIFAPDSANGQDISLVFTQPRVIRIAEKQDFVKILAGKLWTAARADQQFVTSVLKAPVVRVYDIFSPANATRVLLPTEYVGPVTAAAIIPSLPAFVYMGHEAGFVSVWTLETEDGYPRCIEVMKVSTSDVLSLEGVNERLWAGGRNGTISAYDVTQRPWLVSNCWIAHPGLPVLRMAVDHYGIDKIGRLCVVSVGRDEQLRLWDGLLGLDWVDEELLKQEQIFSKTRDLTMLLISWNCDAARPDSLTGDPANVSFLTDALRSVDSPDIVSFGFQEVIDLESRKMAAKNVLLGSKKKAEDGGLSEKVTGAYKRWYDRLMLAMRQAMPLDAPYSVIHTESLVGLFSCIFVKNTTRMSLKDVSITTIKRGMGGRYGNKGGIVARFVIEDSSICLINCHLAAGQNAVRQRNADVAGMLEEKAVLPETDFPFAYVGGGDGTMVLDHEIVFVNGDMNYRIDHRRDAIIAAVRAHDLAGLLSHDQLLREIKFNRACRFRGFCEGPLTFLPTYKYDPRSSEYDSSEKHRSPAWCDRVLWRSRVPSRVHQLHYRRYEANVSDHRPISAAFTVTIKSLQHDVRQKVKAEVQATWINEQTRLLTVAKQFYVRQALI
ncbi:putative inositol polyphosphate 5-phosphatase C9G1.10c [Hypsizygus marmoreus]|uniref:Inositol polyphosphate 5-phosphatase C9G1.10c n=1 Tax=Hypsizygus marmoreus TaxID=39966 RepID=A0A369JID6_HYPMA|nr:putative inositol polyphosphate 5-phosphatase C9G1.10c [Hypsizygus marmoreus]